MQLRLVPQGLIGRVMLVLIGAVLVELIVSAIIFERTDIYSSRTLGVRALTEKMAVAVRVMEGTPAANRPEIARGLSTQMVDVRWLAFDRQPPRRHAALQPLAIDMQRWESGLAGRDLRLRGPLSVNHALDTPLTASARLADGSRLEMTTRVRPKSLGAIVAGLGSAVILSITIMIIAVVLLRGLGSPLRVLARAADSVGGGAPVHVPEEGAGDLRRVARAFNAMQRRIADLLRARTYALAAVSHDLRTPLARIRLQAGLVAEPQTRQALEADVDEVIAMLDSLLAYLGGRHEVEPRRPVDLAALCMTMVDATADAGRPASYSGPERLVSTVQPSAVRRAVDNLIQNALTYGERADVSLHVEEDRVAIRVEDQGPGIPLADLIRVREPFARLDDARARNTKGLGLGLSIVQRVAEHEGGELRLTNLPVQGLRAELLLPLHRPK